MRISSLTLRIITSRVRCACAWIDVVLDREEMSQFADAPGAGCFEARPQCAKGVAYAPDKERLQACQAPSGVSLMLSCWTGAMEKLTGSKRVCSCETVCQIPEVAPKRIQTQAAESRSAPGWAQRAREVDHLDPDFDFTRCSTKIKGRAKSNEQNPCTLWAKQEGLAARLDASRIGRFHLPQSPSRARRSLFRSKDRGEE